MLCISSKGVVTCKQHETHADMKFHAGKKYKRCYMWWNEYAVTHVDEWICSEINLMSA